MGGGPAVLAVADIDAFPLGAKYPNGGADQSLAVLVVNLRQPHHRDIAAQSRRRQCSLFRRGAGMTFGADDRVAFPSRLAGNGIGDRGARRHDQRTAGAGQPQAQGVDDGAVILAIGLKAGKIVIEGQMNDGIGVGRRSC